MSKLHDIGEHILFATGLSRMSSAFLTFLSVHLGFVIFSNLQTVFINTLLIRVTGNSNAVLLYNIMFHSCSAAFFYLSFKMMKNRPPVLTIRIGVLGFAVLYFVFFCIFNHLARFWPVLAALHGLANAFYWTSHIRLIGQYTTDDNRDRALGFTGLVNGFGSLFVPMVSGSVISLAGGMSGYIIMLALSLAVAVATFFLARKLHPVEPFGGHTRYLYMLKLYFTQKLFRYVGLGEFVKCFRDGLMGFYLNILLFQIIESEALVGFNTLLTGGATIFASFVYGKIITARRRISSMYIGTSLLVFCTLGLFLQLSPLTIILYGMLNAFLNIFICNPSGTILYHLANEISELKALQGDFYGVKESFVVGGRLVGFLFVLFFPTLSPVVVLLVIALSQYLMSFAEHMAAREIHKMEQQQEQQEQAALAEATAR